MNILSNRKSIRLKNYDYSQDGYYFLTICTQNRECIFGDIVNREMKPNSLGNLVVKTWELLPNRFPVMLDIFQVMPNHFHAIIIINHDVGAGLVPARGFRATTRVAPTLGNIIGAFKSLTTNIWGQGQFWQRNYYEHIIRTETDLVKIRRYIKTNPQTWKRDRNNLSSSSV